MLEDFGDIETALHDNHSNPLPTAIGDPYLPVVTHAGQFVFLRHESLPYGFSSSDDVASATFAHGHNNSAVVSGYGAAGFHQPSSWQYRTSGAAVNVADDVMPLPPAANLMPSTSAKTSGRFTANHGQQNGAAVTHGSDNTAQVVSHFLLFRWLGW